MESEKQTPMFENLPVYEEDLVKANVEPERFNRVQDNMIYLMSKRGIGLAELSKETCVPMTTIWEWYTGQTRRQLADINLVELARYFDVTLEWLICNDKYDDKDNEG